MSDEKTTEQENNKTNEAPVAETKPTEPVKVDPSTPEATKETEAKPEEKKEEKAEENPSTPEATKDTEKPAELDRTFPDVKPGTVVRVHQEITELNPKGEEKKRIQVFEGTVLARKHGNEINSTVTVRKESSGIAVEKIFPLNSPTVKKIEVVKKFKTVRAKLGFLRSKHKRRREIKE